MRHRTLNEVLRAGGRILTPELVDQPVSRNDGICLREQQHQDAPVARRPEAGGAAVHKHLQRSEQAKLEGHQRILRRLRPFGKPCNPGDPDA
jgi:hypothetical protein